MKVTSKRKNEWFIPIRVALVTHNVKRNGRMLSCYEGMACVLFWIFEHDKFEFKRKKSKQPFDWAPVKRHKPLGRTSNGDKKAKFSEKMFGNSVCWKMVRRIHDEHILQKGMVPNVHHGFLQGESQLKRKMSYCNF